LRWRRRPHRYRSRRWPRSWDRRSSIAFRRVPFISSSVCVANQRVALTWWDELLEEAGSGGAASQTRMGGRQCLT
jgi:hypothetical protein